MVLKEIYSFVLLLPVVLFLFLLFVDPCYNDFQKYF